jgi:hypothetical protein
MPEDNILITEPENNANSLPKKVRRQKVPGGAKRPFRKMDMDKLQKNIMLGSNRLMKNKQKLAIAIAR